MVEGKARKAQAVAARARVLLVEDDADIRELIRYSLARAGFKVEEASDGAEALEKVLSISPDLVVLDVMLPGMTGLEVCQRLRSRPESARLPIGLQIIGRPADELGIIALAAAFEEARPWRDQRPPVE